jgi:type II secretory pathway component PulF
MNLLQTSRFCSQLKMLLSSGVPLLEALQIIHRLSNGKLNESIIKKIAEGAALKSALEPHFPALLVGVVGSAEKAGNLEEVLDKMSTYYAERAEAVEKMRSALLYPSFVMGLCVLCILVLVFFVLPGFQGLFLDAKVELPLLTRIFLKGSESLAKTWPLLFISFLAGIILFLRYRKTEKGLLTIDGLLMRIKLYVREQVANMVRTLGYLLEGGVPLLLALQIAAETSQNRIFRQMMSQAKERVAEGEKISTAFAATRIFPEEALQMLKVGENSGKLSAMFLGIAALYEKEREVFTKRFFALLEPALTLLVGIVVGAVVLGMFLPMLSLISSLQ